jgi:hypothetical protein
MKRGCGSENEGKLLRCGEEAARGGGVVGGRSECRNEVERSGGTFKETRPLSCHDRPNMHFAYWSQLELVCFQCSQASIG